MSSCHRPPKCKAWQLPASEQSRQARPEESLAPDCHFVETQHLPLPCQRRQTRSSDTLRRSGFEIDGVGAGTWNSRRSFAVIIAFPRGSVMVGRGFQPRRNHIRTQFPFRNDCGGPGVSALPSRRTRQTPLDPNKSQVGRDPPVVERELEREDLDAVRLAVALERLREEAAHERRKGLRNEFL